jgi:hypothetical protein
MHMKTRLNVLTIVGFTGLLALFLSGCYTQVGMTRDERRAEPNQYSYSDVPNDTGTYTGNDSGNYAEQEPGQYYDNEYWDSPRSRVGFDYYYPSTYWPSYAFAAAYANPWGYNSYWAYDPWWCGVPYVAYPFYAPGYGYRYNHYYNHGYGSGYGYGYGGSVRRNGFRSFGSTRGSGGSTVNTNNVPPNLDRGAAVPSGRLDASSRPSGRTNIPSMSGNTRSGASQPGNPNSARVNVNRGARGSNISSGRGRVPTGRPVQPQYRPTGRNSHSPANMPQRQGGTGRVSAGPRGGNAPQHFSPPAHQSPPPSSGGRSSQPSGGGRGGNTRGGRP